MKAEKLMIEEKVEFAPVVIQITIETEEELSALWHRTNMGESRFNLRGYNDALPHDVKFPTSVDYVMALWKVLDAVARDWDAAKRRR